MAKCHVGMSAVYLKEELMSAQTSVTIERMKDEELVDKFGVWIGQDEWNDVLDWSDDVIDLFSSYQEGKTKIPEEDANELMLQYEYAASVRNLSNYYAICKTDFSEFWIVNPKPASYLSANQDKKIRKGCASYSELLVFLVLGVARGVWTAVEARYHLASECTATKFISSR